MRVALKFQEKFFVRHNEIRQNPDIYIDNVKRRNIEKYAKDFAYIYNKAWAQHEDNKFIEEEKAIKIFNSMKPVLDENINWFVYEKDEPVACWINLPDLNYYFKHLNGKLSLFQKLKFLWLKKTKPNPRFTGIVFGIITKWQGKGMDSYMIVKSSYRFVPTTSYKNYEMQWIGDFNPKMLRVAEDLGAKVTRKLATYHYLFDRDKTFKRHPII